MGRVVITSNEANQRLDRFLRKYLKEEPLSNIYKLLRKKAVTVNGRKEKENYRLCEGDVLEIHIEGKETAAAPIREAGRDFNIIYEDQNLMIVDKPAELIIHPDAKHRDNTLVDQVIYYLYESGQYAPEKETTFKPAAVNRLDVNTGGMVLFAKNYYALQTLNTMIRNRDIEKYYICIVKGKIEGRTEIVSYLTKDTEKNIVKISDMETPDSKKIHTIFNTVESSENYSLVEVNLLTGRSHQIRAQLASMGHPIIGDTKYGGSGDNKYFRDKFHLQGQFLYAYKLVFSKSQDILSYIEGRTFCSKLPLSYEKIREYFFKSRVEEC